MQQPFVLTIQPHRNNERIATIFQRPYSVKMIGDKTLESVTGLPFVAIQDDILSALRANQHKPAILSQKKLVRLDLNEASGIRLALLFKAVAPLTTVDAIRAVQQSLGAMSDEEVYYWFAKCYGEHAERATHALRILYGAIPM